MAVVHYYYRSKKDTGKLTVRFSHGRGIDLPCSTGIQIPKKSWDKKKERVKNVTGLNNAGEINKKLSDLEKFIIDNFNYDRMTGEEFDGKWIENQIDTFFQRPKHERMEKEEAERNKFFVPFIKFWADNNLKNGKWKNKRTNKPLAYKSVNHYYLCIGFIEKYEEERKVRLKHSDINVDFCDDFVRWMCKDIQYTKPYSRNYAAKTIERIRFFGFRSEESNMDINKEFKSRGFHCPKEETFHPYLNNHEIVKIAEHDFSENEKLDNARDWLIIGCYSALRISDMMHVDKAKIAEYNIIEIFRTKKTDAPVAIPIHPRVQAILDKREGNFPRKISDQRYNDYVKEVCKAVGLKEKVKGTLKDPDTNRVKTDMYEKWKLVSSHIGRRSFATNHFGQVPNDVLMEIGGWKTLSSFLLYIKKKDLNSAKHLQSFWSKGGGEPLRKVSGQ